MAKKTDKTEETIVNPAAIAPKTVPLSEVWADWKRNPRGAGVKPSKADARSFEALKDNIRSMGGLLQGPLVVPEENGNGGKYRIVAGYRRFEAMCDLAADDKARFGTIPVSVRESTDVDYGTMADGEKNEDGSIPVEWARHSKTGALGELLLASTENAMRQDVTVWDRIALTGKMQKEGMDNSEIVHVLGEQGYQLGVTTIANYGKIASLPSKVRKRLQPLGGTGFSHAMAVIKKEFRVGGVPTGPWDETKQMKAIDDLTAAKVERETRKKAGEKPARYVVKPADLADRWEDIEQVASDDVKATLEYLLGRITRADLVNATDEDFAAALTGEGADPAGEGTSEESGGAE